MPNTRSGSGAVPNMMDGFRDMMREMLERQEERIMGNFQTMLEAQKAEIEENVRRQYGGQPSTPRTRTGTGTGDDHENRYEEGSENPDVGHVEPVRVRCNYKDFNACYPPSYGGAPDPIVLHNWINEMEMAFTACQCLDIQRTGFAVTKLKEDALQWWIDYQGTNGKQTTERMSWEEFLEELKDRFCTVEEVRSLEREFLGFKKGGMTLSDYNSKFLKLMSFSRRLVPDEGAKISQYVEGLPYQVQMSMGEPTTLHNAMRRAIKLVKTTEAHEKEKGGNRLSKRKIEDSPKGEDKVDERKPNNRKRSKSWDEKSKPLEEVTCFKCGEIGHFANNCPKKAKCYECGERGHLSFQCLNKEGGGNKEGKKEEKNAKGRVFQLTTTENQEGTKDASGSFLFSFIYKGHGLRVVTHRLRQT